MIASHEGRLADSLVNAWEQRLRLEIGVADKREENISVNRYHLLKV